MVLQETQGCRHFIHKQYLDQKAKSSIKSPHHIKNIKTNIIQIHSWVYFQKFIKNSQINEQLKTKRVSNAYNLTVPKILYIKTAKVARYFLVKFQMMQESTSFQWRSVRGVYLIIDWSTSKTWKAILNQSISTKVNSKLLHN